MGFVDPMMITGTALPGVFSLDAAMSLWACVMAVLGTAALGIILAVPRLRHRRRAVSPGARGQAISMRRFASP